VDSCHVWPQHAPQLIDSLAPFSSQAVNPLPGALPYPPMAGPLGPVRRSPVSLMFHRMVPLTRMPPRRTRKAPSTGKAENQGGGCGGRGGGAGGVLQMPLPVRVSLRRGPPWTTGDMREGDGREMHQLKQPHTR